MKASINVVNQIACCLAAGLFALGLAVPTLAQRTPAGPPAGAGPPANNNPSLDDRIRQTNESKLRSTELDAAAESEKEKRIQAAIGHMKEDFARIQVLRNDIARNLVARKPLDYELVAHQTGEINRRASELNVFMMAHSPEDKAQDKPTDLESDEMVGSLVRLCKLIDSFTENPALKNAATLDVKEVGKAREEKARADKDLLEIIRLSESIRKASTRLRASG
jgi:hypothetical protein